MPRLGAVLLIMVLCPGCDAPPEPPPGDPAVRDPRLPVGETSSAGPATLSSSSRRPSPVAIGPFRFEPALELPRPDSNDIIAGATAVLDFDDDGDLDLFVPVVTPPSPLLRNDGDFRFTRVLDEIGIPEVLAYGTAVGDCDADGRVDLLVAGIDRMAMLRNLGGRFSELVGALPEMPVRSSSALFLDADGDGDLDLYVTCYLGEGGGGCGDHLLVNDGTCRFTDESRARGPLGTGVGHAAAAIDFDEDGDPDVVVSNDLGFDSVPDQLLENDGTGHFAEVAAQRGLAQGAFSMSAEVADLDGDGILDVYKGNICRSPLLLGTGPRTGFVDGGLELGLPSGWILAPDQPALFLPPIDPDNPPTGGEALFILQYMQDRPDPLARCLTAWGTETADLDADGRLELFVANGGVSHRFESDLQPDQLLWRAPGSEVFTEVGESAGLADTGRGRTAVFADLDADAKLDLVVGNAWFGEERDVPGRAFRNVSRQVGNALFVTLRGPGANRDGIGAVVEVTAGGRRQVAYRSFGTSFLAASAAPLHFGLGDAPGAEEVVVRWPWGGGVDRVRDVPAGTLHVVHGGGR